MASHLPHSFFLLQMNNLLPTQAPQNTKYKTQNTTVQGTTPRGKTGRKSKKGKQKRENEQQAQAKQKICSHFYNFTFLLKTVKTVPAMFVALLPPFVKPTRIGLFVCWSVTLHQYMHQMSMHHRIGK